MMAKIHEVKLHAKYFDLVLEGKKRAEFRKKIVIMSAGAR